MNRNVKLLREARASLLGNKLRAFFMMLGLVIGVASLTVVICIGEGTRAKITSKVAEQGSDIIIVRPGGARQVFAPATDRSIATLVEADVEAIEAGIGNIRYISPVQNQRDWEVIAGDQSAKSTIFGVGPDYYLARHREMGKGGFISQSDLVNMAKVAVLGTETAKALFGTANPVGQSIRIGSAAFQVKGVLAEQGVSLGGNEKDDRVLIPFTTSSKQLFGRLYLEHIDIQVRDRHKLPQTAGQVRSLLRERHQIHSGAEDDFFVREPEDVVEAALATSSTLTTLLMVISGVSLLVGGIVIMNLMLISVSQRVHEIGLRRTVGARRQDILRQFLLESVSVALAGGLVGAVAGAGIALLLAWCGVAVSRITWLPFSIAFVACGVVAVLFGLYPARKAARLDPVAALREKQL